MFMNKGRRVDGYDDDDNADNEDDENGYCCDFRTIG